MIEARPGGSRAPLALAGALLAAAGAGAQIVLMLWLREQRLALGGANAALSGALAALWLGQACGARVGERVALRAANPLQAFGALALAAALCALASPPFLAACAALLGTQYDALLAHPLLLASARGLAGLLTVLPATLALGALFPALLAATLGGLQARGGASVALFAVSALGSTLGAAFATFALVERMGLRGALALGAALLAAVGACALVAARRWGRVAPAALASHDAGAVATCVALPRWLLALAALSGFGTVAAQSLCAQALGRISNQSVYAIGCAQVVALACVGLGALFVYSLSARTHPQRTLGVSLAIAGGTFLIFPSAFVAASGGLSSFVVDAPWPAYFVDFFAFAGSTTAPVLLPAACVLPSLLAAASLLAGRDGRRLGAAVARLLTAYALGAVLGAAGPVLLTPALGLWAAFAFLGALYLSGSLRPLARSTGRRFAVYAAILAVLLFAVVRPDAQPALRLAPETRVVALRESASGLVAVLDGPNGRTLQLDNYSLLGGKRDRVRQERQGHLALLLHERPERALFLGSAMGSSASAALAQRAREITLVELAPGVADAARAELRSENRGVHDDARVRVVRDDAHGFLRASRASFDVIVSDAFVPWQAGASGLFSREHFARARAHLAPGGVFCQWLALHQLTASHLLVIARTFARVFPGGEVWRGDFYGSQPTIALCGREHESSPDPLREVRTLPVSSDRWLTLRAGVRAFYVGRVHPRWLGDGPIETERAPVLEFSAARAHSGRLAAAITGIAWSELSLAIATDPEARAGVLLQSASALRVAGRREDAAVLLAEAANLLPASLVGDAPADPSFAER